MRLVSFLAAALATTVLTTVAQATTVVRVEAAAFAASAGKITFSEFASGTVEPTYAPGDYGGILGASPIVDFAGFFSGQSLGTVATCAPGALVSGCVVGSPTGPLSLDKAGSPNAFITTDAAFPSSPTLSGTPEFSGPIAILFDRDVVGVGLDGGFFDGIGTTSIRAYDALGNLLGETSNDQTGIDFLGLVTDDGSAKIRGLLFSIVGSEIRGFGIDNLVFAGIDEVVVPPPPPGPDPGETTVPAPSTLALLGLGLAGLLRHRRRRG